MGLERAHVRVCVCKREREEKLSAESIVVWAVIPNVIFTGVWARVCVEIGVALNPPRILERDRGKWIDRSIDRRISISYASAPVIFSVRRKCQAVMKNLPYDDQSGPSFRPSRFYRSLSSARDHSLC